MNYYYLNVDKTHSRIKCLQGTDDLRFSIGEKFDSYDFSQPMTEKFSDLVVERLLQLRKKYSHLRLWFSGGKDSRIILDTAIKHNILLDEIITIVHMPAGQFSIGAQVELEFNAVRYLKSLSLFKTKLSIIDFQSQHYAAGFGDSSWVHYISDYTLHSPFYPGPFFKFVNPEFNLVEKTDDVGDIAGNVHPHIEWDGLNWKFFYVDFQLNMNTNTYSENFLVCDDMPQLCHAYVRDQVKINQHRTASESKFSIPPNRTFRDMMPEYGDILIPRPELEMPKMFDGSWKPYPELPIWQANSTYKHWVNCVACLGQDPLPLSMQNYINNTPWDLVKFSLGHPGISTSKFLYA